MSGHYIAYKFIEGTIYHFDDAMVNSTPMLNEYETNLIFYCRADIPPYAWDIDFGFITHRPPDLYGCKSYSLRDSLPISIDLNQTALQSQPVFPEAVPISITPDASDLHEQSKEVLANNETTDKTKMPKTDTESNPKPCEQNELDNTEPDNRSIEEKDKDLDSSNDKAPIHENAQNDNIPDDTNKHDVADETVEQLEQNPNINIIGVATIEELDETLQYPLQNGSESSSSGSSPHSDDEKQGQSSIDGAIPKTKPDLSLKPKLITLHKPMSTQRK